MSELPDAITSDHDDTKVKPFAAVDKLHRLDASVLLDSSRATAAGSSTGSPSNADFAMVDSSSSLHSEESPEEEPLNAVDVVLDRIDACMRKMHRVKRSVIKRRASEADLLTQVEVARDLLQEALQGDKLQLNAVYGGQCVRIGRLRHMLDTTELSVMYANDQRWKHIQNRVESVEAILKELGTYKRWVPPVSSIKELFHATATQSSIPLLEASSMDMGEMGMATMTPAIAGVWDGAHDGGVQIIQRNDIIEILIGDELRGKFAYDHEKGVFVGTLDGEEVHISIENGELKFSNGVAWEKRPVDVVGSWDRLGDGLRFLVTQKGAQIVAVAQDALQLELRGTITRDAIRLSRESDNEDERQSEAVTGSFDDAKKTITWSDDTMWLKRPKVDIVGTWSEVPGTGNASYYQGMVLTMLGSKLACDHVTLAGEGTVNDAAEISFRFNNRGEASADVSCDTIQWADGTQWRRQSENEHVNNIEDPSVIPWRRRYSFGPMRRSFYLDSFSQPSDEDAVSLPDLFYVNTKSTGDTQAAYSSAFESFCYKINTIDSLDEVLAQRGAGITLPQNWMVWMVHRVWLNDPSVTTLSFANMEIPEARLERNIGPKLMEALKTNTFLETLELQNTNLQAGESINLLADALRVNRTLKSLNLEGNAIDSTGLVAIADSLKQNVTLEVLKVHHQKTRSIGVQVEERFHDAMDINTTLVKLGIALQNPGHRDQIDRKLLQNAEKKRRMRRARENATNVDR